MPPRFDVYRAASQEIRAIFAVQHAMKRSLAKEILTQVNRLIATDRMVTLNLTVERGKVVSVFESAPISPEERLTAAMGRAEAREETLQ
ncbi:hypothetical protein Aam_045_003 [Acidocella aminolytica 101 = DSM 11237]|uniref:Uncharacterized protein n=1 Tax=Acidocella aminolytica 101 = DSM 11237 TaxID=1120923 RepID=A0A0D6PHL6_9PROT|nr:hypothetical protein Aam_045_003 [Acidocella aminolytica 101 = DSM 11237]GBQ43001.1 hypothetical protein AA11237_3140 [Acidocella aminolytica 101 = DSM 11237]